MEGNRTLPHEGATTSRFGTCIWFFTRVLAAVHLEIGLLVEDAGACFTGEESFRLCGDGRARARRRRARVGICRQ